MIFLRKKAPRNGWQDQAEHLALTHTGLASAALTAAEQVLVRSPDIPASCHLPCHYAGPEHKTVAGQHQSKSTNEPYLNYSAETQPLRAVWAVRGRRETLAARALRSADAEGGSPS